MNQHVDNAFESYMKECGYRRDPIIWNAVHHAWDAATASILAQLESGNMMEVVAKAIDETLGSERVGYRYHILDAKAALAAIVNQIKENV